MFTYSYKIYRNSLGEEKLEVTYDINNGIILSNFMMYEVICFKEEIESIFNDILENNVPLIEFNFNFSKLVVNKDKTIVVDVDLEEENACIVNTKDLYVAILDWCEKYHEFELKKNKQQ